MAREFKTGLILPEGTLDSRALEVASASELTSGQVDTASDYLIIYDASGGVMKKVKPDNLGVGGGGGGSFEGAHPGYVSGRVYGAQGMARTTNSASFYTGYMWIVPVYVRAAVAITKLGMYVFTGSTANGRLGLYQNADGLPTTLLASGEVVLTSAGWKFATVSVTVDDGWYWLALTLSGTANIVTEDLTYSHLVTYMGRPYSNPGYYTSKLYASHAYGALPNPAPSSWTAYNDASPYLVIGT